MTKHVALSLLIVVVLSACSRPHDQIIPSDVSKWDTELKPVMAKLSDEDRRLLAGYLIRAKAGELFGNAKTPAFGITVGQAIKDQKKLMEEQAKKEADAAALKERLARERAETKKKIDDILVVSLLEKQLQPADFQAGRLLPKQLFRIGFQNKGAKDIAGVKGELKLIDMFGKEVGGVGFTQSSVIGAGKTTSGLWSRDYNQFIQSHRDVADLPEGKYKARFEPEAVIFSDGTRLEVKGL